MVSFVVPLTALPGATRFPAPPISIHSRYVLYYGPAPINSTPTVTVAATATNGRSVSFAATATLAESTAQSYKWTFSDGTTKTTSVNTTSYTFPTAGNVSCTVLLTDSFGLTATNTISLAVTEGAPTVTAVAAANGQAVTWTATGTDPEGGALTYSWTGNDGFTGTGASVTYTYPTAGAKTATVTATDTMGATATATSSVTIVAPDANGIITADTFSTAAAGATAVAARNTEPGSLGGAAMRPAGASGVINVAGGTL